MRLFKQAASNGSSLSQLTVGNEHLQQGEYAIAIPLLEASAEAGVGVAQQLLGELHLGRQAGKHPPYARADQRKGIEYLKQASDNGVAVASLTLANVYGVGIGLPAPDLVGARELLSEAAESGLSLAQANLGLQYYGDPQQMPLQLGFEKDHEQARKWLELASRQGVLPAMVRLAHMQAGGEGGEVDWNQAQKWVEKAADANDVDAIFMQACWHLDGVVYDESPQKARSCFRQAAASGDADACRMYGVLLAEGVGGRQDVAEAGRWLRKAAQQGDQQASQLLRRLGG